MNRGIFFGGRNIVKPGVYANVNADAMVPVRLGAANTIGVIGTAQGGAPRTITPVLSPVDARAILKGGVLADVIDLMYDPSPELPGAGDVHFYRLNAALQSALTIQEVGLSNVITLTARDYGVRTNQIRVKVEAGTNSGKKITLNDVLTTNYEIGDDLANAFSIHYVGSKFASQLIITKTGDAATLLKLQTKATGSGDPWVDEVSQDLTVSALATLGQLVAFLNGLGSYVTIGVGNSQMPTAYLDAVAGQDIKSATFTAGALIGAIVYWVNSTSLLASAARVTSATLAPANLAFTFFQGGSEGAVPNNADWQVALDAFAQDDVSFIFVATEDAAVHAMAVAHCNAQSDVKTRRERQTILGGSYGESVAQVLARAGAIADKRAVVCYPGIKRINLFTGLIDQLSPMYLAACVTGMCGGSTPETPLTFKSIRCNALERVLSQTDIESLLNFGVLAVEQVPSQGTFRIVQGITTYLQDNNTTWRKIAGVRIADYLNRTMRDGLDPLVGRVGDKRTVTSILNRAVSVLNKQVRGPANQGGVLTTGTDSAGNFEPAFKNVRAVYDGQELVGLTYEAHPVGEIAFITVTAGLTPTQIVQQA